VLRGVVATTVLVVLYYLLPLDRPAGVRVLLGAVRRGQQRRAGTSDGDGPAAI
jgi:hypothetical protein